MGRLKSKLGRRFLAVALSVAMVMSNMTVYASELSGPKSETTIADEVETEETKTESSTKEKDEKANDADDENITDSEDEKTSDDEEKGTSEKESSTVESSKESREDTKKDTSKSEDEEVTEEESKEVKAEGDGQEQGKYELDTTKDITAFAVGDKSDGQAEKAGTSGYFTIIYSAKSKVDSSTKTFDDGYKGTQRINFGEPPSCTGTLKNVIEFTTAAAATVKVYWAEADKDGARQMVIVDGDDGTTQVATTEGMGTWTQNSPYVSDLEVPKAGKYYLGGSPNSNYIFRVIVTEKTETVEPVDPATKVKVSGSVTCEGDSADANYSGIGIVFKTGSGEDAKEVSTTVKAANDAGEYTYLAEFDTPESESETYNVSLTNSKGYDLADESKTFTLNKNAEQTYNITLTKASSYKLSGTVSGLDSLLSEDTDGKIKISFIPLKETGEEDREASRPDTLIVKSLTDKKYEVELQTGVTYEIKTEGANDYEPKTGEVIKKQSYTISEKTRTVPTVTLTEDKSNIGLEYVLKPTKKITVTAKDPTITADKLNGAVITFTHKDDKDKYEFTIGSEGTTAANALGEFPLREGTYTVDIKSDNYYIKGTANDLVVESTDKSYEIELAALAVIEPVEGTKYTLDATELGVGTKPAEATWPEEGVSNKFKVVYRINGTTKVENCTISSWLNGDKKNDDGEHEEYVKDSEAPDLNNLVGLVSGGSSTTANGRYIQFTTTSYAKIKLFWSPNTGTADAVRQIAITNSNNYSYDVKKNIVSTNVKGDNNHGYISELTISDAGTYNLVFQANAILYKIVLTEIDMGERTDWTDVALPVIKSVAPNADDKTKLDITVDAVVGHAGGDSLTVTMKNSNGDIVGKAESNKDGSTHTISLTPDDSAESGTYTFTAELARTIEDTKRESQTPYEYEYKKPLSAPKVEIWNLGKGAVKVSWKAVAEAEKYTVTVKDAQGDAVTGINEEVLADSGKASYEVTIPAEASLTAGSTYTFIVTAFKGKETAEGTKTATVTEEEDVEDEHVLITSDYDFDGNYPIGTTFDNGYFVVTGTVKGVSESYFELPKSSGGAIRFRVTGTATVTVGAGSTGASNDSPIAVINEKGAKMKDTNGNEEFSVVGTGSTAIVYELPAGIYKVLTTGSKRAARLYSIEVLEKGAIEIKRGDWGSAPNPQVTKVGQDADKDTGALKDTMTVEVTMPISDAGADAVRAEIRDDEGRVIVSEVSVEWTDKHKITITPGASGNYTVAAVAYRNDAPTATKEGIYEKEKPFLFKLPLTQPVIASATSVGRDYEVKGECAVEVEWQEVREADEYVITAKKVVASADKAEIKEAEDTTKAEDITKTVRTSDLPKDKDGKIQFKAVVSSDKFEAGQKYAVTVQAKRDAASVGQEAASAVSEAKEVMVTDDGKTKWGSIIYGSSTTTDAKKDGFRNIVYNDSGDLDSVDVYSISNGGKIVPNSTDGIAFWYTEVDPKTDNFTLIATAEVNNWTYSNGQEGFGLIAVDRIPEVSSGDMFWNNSYMAMVSKVEYFWDGENVTDAGDKISMYLGVGSLEKQGVTPEGLQELENGATIPTTFTTLTETLETSCAKSGKGTYNLVDKATNAGGVAGTIKKPYSEFKLMITKNNTGYFVSYWDPNKEGGAGWSTNKYYDTEALSKLNEDTVYVGFFASRNADIKFKDITFKKDDPENHGPAEEKPISYVTPLYQMLSASTSNSAQHELVFNSNWNGELSIKDCFGDSVLTVIGEDGKPVLDKDGKPVTVDTLTVKGNLDTSADEITEGMTEEEKAKVNPNPRKAKVTVPLAIGVNEFNVSFKPDSTWQPNKTTQLSTYETSTFKHTVSYRKYGEDGNYLYVGPDGKSTGLGTKDQPLDIYTAIKYVQAGQTILLKSGTYNLTKTIRIERGTSGTTTAQTITTTEPDGTTKTETKTVVDKYIYMIAEDMAPTSSLTSNVVFDFGGRCPGMVIGGDCWYFKGFDVTRASDGDKGIQVSGNYNTLDQLRTYKNGNTGIQISRYHGTDATQAEWPSYNKILNCTSYLNADSGYEDADGFSAKLTVGPGNVFDGCISFYNADDGWDLFAKAETGTIGQVTIQNSVAYKNGYVLRTDNGTGGLAMYGEEGAENIKEVSAGNGNGFKMGGESLPGRHTLINSIAFNNKAKGIDCNSCPDIRAFNCVSFNNEGYNVAFYTNNASVTNFVADCVISYRTEYKDVADQIKLKNQTNASETVNNRSFFQWKVSKGVSQNSEKTTVEDSWFKLTKTANELDESKHITDTITRNPNGTVNRNDFLVLTEDAVKIMSGLKTDEDNTGEFGDPGEGSDDTINTVDPDKVTDGSIDKGDEADKEETEIPIEDLDKMPGGEGNYTGLWMVIENEDAIYYTGNAVKPEVRVYMGTTLLTQGTDYSISYKNNTRANKTKDDSGNEVDVKDAKGYPLPSPVVTVTGKKAYEGTVSQPFGIKAVDLSNTDPGKPVVCVTDVVEVTNGRVDLRSKVPAATYNGKTLAKNKDFTVELLDLGQEGAYKYINSDGWRVKLTAVENSNYTGSREARIRIYSKSDVANGKVVLVSKLKVSTIQPQLYAGEEIEPALVVKNGNREIEQGAYTYFEPVYYNNTGIGTASICITGTGEADPVTGVTYVGSKTVNFKIIGGQLNEKNFDFVISDTKYGVIPMSKGAMLLSVPYAGQAVKFGTVIVKTKKEDCAANVTGKVYQLTENKQYTVTYKNNDKAGTASITITGINGYTGSFRKNFKITPFDISSGAGVMVGKVSREEAEVNSGITVGYTQGGAVLSNGILRINGKIVDAKNYKVTYKNNKASYTILSSGKNGTIESKAPVATIRGRNGLKGTIKVRFNIGKKDISIPGAVSVTANDIVWKPNGNAAYYESKVVVRDSNGKVIPASEYTVEYYLVNKDGTVKNLIEAYRSLSLDTSDPERSSADQILTDNGRTIIAKVKAVEADTSSRRHSYTGSVDKEYRVVLASMKNAKVKVINAKYYGDAALLTKDIEVSLGVQSTQNGRIITQTRELAGGMGNDYIIESVSGTGRIGTAKATLRGIGKYGGTKVVSYKVRKQSWNISKAVVDGEILVPVANKEEILGMTLTERTEDGEFKYANEKGDNLLTDRLMMNGKYLLFHDGANEDPNNAFEVLTVLNQQYDPVPSYVYPSLTKGKPVYEKDADGHYVRDERGRKIVIGTGYKVTVTLQGIGSYGGKKKISFTAYVPITNTTNDI